MTKINMPNFTKSLISLAFLNPGLFYKAKNPLVFKHFICNTLDLNNLQFDGCGAILCSNYISRASGSITFDTMKIENFGMQTVVQASEQPSARSMVSIDASCTAGGTTQILDRWHGERMLATWRNDAEGKIVMISLHRPATGHGKIQRMACCAGGAWAQQNASQAGFRAAPERPSHESHTTILSAIADNALADICYVAMNKTLVRVRAGVLKEKKGNEVMYMTLQQPDQVAFSVDQCASALGIDEFSLLSRIQMGEINAVRARSGEIKIPESELERLTPSSLRATPDESGEQQIFSDRNTRRRRRNRLCHLKTSMKSKLTVPKKITLTLTPDQQEMLSCFLAVPQRSDATAATWASEALTTGLQYMDRHYYECLSRDQRGWLRARGFDPSRPRGHDGRLDGGHGV